MSDAVQADPIVYDCHGIPIERGDVVKIFHFIGPRRKRHYLYNQCLGPATYPNGTQKYVFFSHLNFIDAIGERDGPYHEHGGSTLPHYEIVQSIKCDHEQRLRAAKEGK